ncbi:C-type lectin 37Db-like [Cochliomyia hominivorax]
MSNAIKMIKIFFKFFIVLYLITLTKAQLDYIPEYSATVSNVFLGEPLDKSFKKVGNKAYHFGQNKVSWFKALLICRSVGGHLTSIDSQNELKELSSYLVSKFGTNRIWWLSGSDQESEGDFFWYSTGRRFEYADWALNQPDNKNNDEDCVYLEHTRPSYQMFDGKCNRTAYYICESNTKTIVLNVT